MFSPFPMLNTERLSLINLTDECLPFLLKLRSDKKVAEFLDRELAHSIEDVIQFYERIKKGIIEDKWIMWGLELKTTKQLIGTVCLWNFSEDKLKAEIGYEMLPEFNGYGYMTEAVKIVIDYAFNELNLLTIYGEVAPENIKSTNILQKFEFTLLIGPGENVDDSGNILPTVVYSLNR